MEDQARLSALSYQSTRELLAERFHVSEQLLRDLNPDAAFDEAGSSIIVPVPGPPLAASVERIEVDKSTSEIRAYDSSDTIVASYPVTIGSAEFPSPSGSMEVVSVTRNPKYHFDPKGRNWGPTRAVTLAPGPNSPVGTTWIALSEETYGIHGSPDPQLIAKTSSHGCVRLTNWDAEELREAVSKGTRVDFVGLEEQADAGE